MIPQEKYEIWQQEQLKELEDTTAALPPELRPDNLVQYALFIHDQMSLDEYEQELQIDDTYHIDNTEEYARNQELLLRKEEWEDLAIRLQQLKQNKSEYIRFIQDLYFLY